MEEILASIRRIIADDQSLPGRTPLRDAPAFRSETAHTPPSETPHSFLSEEAAARAEEEQFSPSEELEEAAPQAIHAMSAHGAVAAPQYPTPQGPAAEPIVPPSGKKDSPPDGASADDLAYVVPASSHRAADGRSDARDLYFTSSSPAVDEPKQAQAGGAGAGLFSATTNQSVLSAFNVLAATRLADNSDELLGLAREMIRPLLKTWLDDNLPSMVERMVRAEIERVARGGR